LVRRKIFREVDVVRLLRLRFFLVVIFLINGLAMTRLTIVLVRLTERMK
jgi:hypothetical protein